MPRTSEGTGHQRELRCSVVPRALTEPFRIAGRVYEAFDTIVVEITQGMRTGRGEGAPIAYLGQTAQRLAATVQSVEPLVAGGCSRDALRQAMLPDGARNAIDCALWDLEAQITDVAAWRLAGVPEPGPVLTTFTVGCDSPDAMAASALRWSQARALKLKLCGDGVDGARIAAVRGARPDVWLGVDANRSLSPASFEALRLALTANRVALVEQPLPVGMEEAVAGLACPVPVYADESVQGLHDLHVAAGRFDGINLKLDKCGGLTEALLLIAEARFLGLAVMLGNMGGSSLAMAPALAIAALADHADLDGPIYLAADETPAVEYRGGLAVAPDELWGSRRVDDGTGVRA